MSELPRATRKYVVLGLVFVVAMVLAIREVALRSDNQGAPDEWHRVLRVDTSGRSKPHGPDPSNARSWDNEHVHSDEAIALGRDLLDDPAADPLDAVIAVADEYGYGFLLIDLNDGWDLSQFATVVPPGARHAVISIGDVAREGMRINFGVPVSGPFDYGDPSRDQVERDLALFEHPDLHALFHDPNIEGPSAERSRWALGVGNGDYVPELEMLRDQQKWLADIDQQWPSGLSGNLAGRWEGVRAVPVRTGVLLEIMSARLVVPGNPRESKLRGSYVSELWFVPTEALAAGLDPIAARRPCVGVRERRRTSKEQWFGFEVAPDGRTVVVALGDQTLDIYRWVSKTPDVCELEWIEEFEEFDPVVREWPRVSNAGELSWREISQVSWRDASEQIHELERFGADAGPWWTSDNLLVLLGWDHTPFETVIMLLRTGVDSPSAPRALLDASDLFPNIDPYGTAAKLTDVQPVGSDELLVVTMECPSSIGYDAPRHCLHRVRFRKSLSAQLGRRAMREPIELDRSAVEVRTLGPIDSYASLAIAADGTRAVYVGVPEEVGTWPKLFAVDIGETSLGPSEEIADRIYRDSRPRIGPDGRVVVIDDWVEIGKFGGRPTARAFVLGPPER